METVASDGNLVLRRRQDGNLELRANGVFVMDTVETSTERELAARALALHPAPARVLVGGLGLGYTLAAVLADRRVERCTVAEIEPALVSWLRDGIVAHGPALLADDRVEVRVEDVAVVLRTGPPAAYDLVLLDVDNGPGYLVHEANAGLYAAPALTQARAATAPGGMVVIWSSAEAPELGTAMRAVFGDVEELDYSVRIQTRAERYWLYAARVTSNP
ncbi:MAG: hypothetical protein QM638_19235 [Nocardioides sp.]|uniref:spermidine synthase n=1 Tax=Nocardioides sp. TaxID=35761 RepID=UPI0039E5669B